MNNPTNEQLWLIIVIGVFVVWALYQFIAFAVRTVRKAKLYDNLGEREAALRAEKAQVEAALRAETSQLEADKQAWGSYLESQKKLNEHDREVVLYLAKEKSVGFPWLAEAYADYFRLRDMQIANYLERKRPSAKKSADIVREIASSKREAERAYRATLYLLKYYEAMYPFLIDLKGQELDEYIEHAIQRKKRAESGDLDASEEAEDQAKIWLSRAEYNTLSSAEKYQRALDHYMQRQKTSWEIGRDYERYIGYLYEMEGWRVEYKGIIDGFEDLGRDLIAKKGNSVQIVQCKYWRQESVVREKHIFQLYGTVIAYRYDHPGAEVTSAFFTSTVMSERAKGFANLLNIYIRDQVPLQQYPCIKCNVSRKDGRKIYHLPFDQQYDTTIIERERGETYVGSVLEAERLGFRRALHWMGHV